MLQTIASSESQIEVQRARASVVIVCYNQARYLKEAIESVLAQTYQPLEIILVDDGSTDETAAVADAYPQVDYLWQTNRGLAAARNTGLRFSSSDYIAFLDADDRLLPHAIQSGVDCLKRSPECAFVYGGFRNVFGDGSPAPTDPAEPVASDHYRNLLQGNFIGMHAAVLYRRAVLNEVDGFNERLPACEDYELYLRIARHRSVQGYADVVAEYRQHDSNMSKDHAFMLRSVLSVLRMERAWLPDRRHREALRAGIHVWQEYYGARLLETWKSNRTIRGFARMLRLNPRGALKWAAQAVHRRVRRPDRRRTVDLGSLRRLEPFSRQFGFDRGQPVDRYYIEAFLVANAGSVRGRVLEIGDDYYSRRFGGDRITHVTAGQPGATITADLSCAPHVPSGVFDCIILTQTMQYIFDVQAAAATLQRILKPGGVLLATVPGISQICRDQSDRESDCWRFTSASTRRLFGRQFGDENVRVETHGNVLAATAFLHGLAAHELRPEELDRHDPDYQLTISVIARKGQEAR